MLINNIDISRYNARVLEINIQNSNISNISDFETKNRLIPLFLNSEAGLNKITVTLLVDSLEKKQYYLDKSNLINNMLNVCDVYFKDRDLRFKCVLLDQSDKPSLRQIRGTLQLNLIGYNVENEIIENINRIKSKTINATGNLKTPCIVEITPVIDMIDLTIQGLSEDPLIVRNLKGNKTIKIDSLKGTVTQDGINKFLDTDMWEFPYLCPGPNAITVNKDTCNIKIIYNPRFL